MRVNGCSKPTGEMKVTGVGLAGWLVVVGGWWASAGWLLLLPLLAGDLPRGPISGWRLPGTSSAWCPVGGVRPFPSHAGAWWTHGVSVGRRSPAI